MISGRPCACEFANVDFSPSLPKPDSPLFVDEDSHTKERRILVSTAFILHGLSLLAILSAVLVR